MVDEFTQTTNPYIYSEDVSSHSKATEYQPSSYKPAKYEESSYFASGMRFADEADSSRYSRSPIGADYIPTRDESVLSARPHSRSSPDRNAGRRTPIQFTIPLDPQNIVSTGKNRKIVGCIEWCVIIEQCLIR